MFIVPCGHDSLWRRYLNSVWNVTWALEQKFKRISIPHIVPHWYVSIILYTPILIRGWHSRRTSEGKKVVKHISLIHHEDTTQFRCIHPIMCIVKPVYCQTNNESYTPINLNITKYTTTHHIFSHEDDSYEINLRRFIALVNVASSNTKASRSCDFWQNNGASVMWSSVVVARVKTKIIITMRVRLNFELITNA